MQSKNDTQSYPKDTKSCNPFNKGFTENLEKTKKL